jgi:serine protease Do
MQVGDTIYTVGNPLGELDYTMTSGIVSALDRVIQVDAATSINMFQIDAAVNSGNSGGPVYNSEGKVIGIVSAKYASAGVEGLGFAIPINDAVDIVSQLITNGYVAGKPSLGISVRDWSSAYAQYYGTPEGALVEAVEPGSAADKAGVRIGDIITKLGDTDVTSTETLLIAKKMFSAGDTTTIVVSRDGEELTLTITFDEEGITATSSRTADDPQMPQQGLGALPGVAD